MRLTIIDSKSHEPMLIIEETDKGLQVVGGDARMVNALGLQKFSSLKEISDHINSAESDVQAIMDDGQDSQSQPDQNPDMDSRIKPALDMIRTLMQKVNERKKREKINEDSDKPEYKIANTSESEVLFNPNDQIYVSVDGDNIGNAVARAEETDDEDKLTEISSRINAGQDIMKDWAIRMGGYVVEQGGDEAVMKVPATAMSDLENLRSLYVQTVGATCSIGVGKKISESTKSRMLAKLKGKDRVVVFDKSTSQELELRLKDKDSTEASKIRNAMRPDEDLSNNPENPRAIEGDPRQEANTGAPAQEEQEIEESYHPEPYKGSTLSGARLEEVQQEEKGKPEKSKKEEQPQGTRPVGAIDHNMLKAAIDLDKKPKTGSKYGDPEIDNHEVDDADEQETNYVRNAMYLAKHGDRIK